MPPTRAPWVQDEEEQEEEEMEELDDEEEEGEKIGALPARTTAR
jgi:hypothetical protein